MKKKLYIKTAFLSLAAMAMLSSCLKDNAHYVDFADTKPLVEIPQVTGVVGTGEFQAEAFNIVSAPTPLNLLINVAAPQPLKTALNVKLSVDAAALTAYNTAKGTSYVLLPPADYSSSLAVTIPANTYQANLVININTSVIDPSQSYVLPLTITDGGGQQISNYKTILYNIQVKNKYDGVYTVTGTLVDATTASITGDFPNTVSLITQGATTVAYADSTGSAASFKHLIYSGGLSSYGEFAPVFTFDPTTNKVTSVVNYYGQPSATRFRAAVLDPTGTNGFISGTPGTTGAVFEVKYIMTQSGNNRTYFDETYTLTGGR
jgi:hypothetical protein